MIRAKLKMSKTITVDKEMRPIWRVHAVCVFNGESNTRYIAFHDQDMIAWKHGHKSVQQAFPYISADDREFLMTGSTPEIWDSMFG